MTILTKPFTGSLAKKPETEAEDDQQLIKVPGPLLVSVSDPDPGD